MFSFSSKLGNQWRLRFFNVILIFVVVVIGSGIVLVIIAWKCNIDFRMLSTSRESIFCLQRKQNYFCLLLADVALISILPHSLFRSPDWLITHEGNLSWKGCMFKEQMRIHFRPTLDNEKSCIWFSLFHFFSLSLWLKTALLWFWSASIQYLVIWSASRC